MDALHGELLFGLLHDLPTAEHLDFQQMSSAIHVYQVKCGRAARFCLGNAIEQEADLVSLL